MATTLDVFISSKMVELRAERETLYEFLPTLNYGDIKLRAWVFEDEAPASDRSTRDVYLEALQNAALYIGLFWKQYGEWTIDEFERATEWGIERHIYVKDVDAGDRNSQLSNFLEKWGHVSKGINPKWFQTTEQLKNVVKQSIETWIGEKLRRRPGGTNAVLCSDPDDLPEKPRKLIGRDDLLSELKELLEVGERVLLQGYGGMGKTALAATAAADWIQTVEGPVLWLKAGSASADAIFEALARRFNEHQAVARELGDAKNGAVRAVLRRSGVKLLVLDDCWNGQALHTVLKTVPSDMPLIVTARQRYALDNILEVGELKPDDALTLLLTHAKQNATDDARALCSMIGYHAFSIEIAGKTMKAQKCMPGKLLEQIRDAPHNLKMPADFSEKERRSVKDLLDASVHALDRETRNVFLAFGAFFAPQLTAEMISQYQSALIAWGDEDLSLPAVASPSSRTTDAVEKALNTLQIHGLADIVAETDESVEHCRIHDLAYSYVRAQATDEQRRKALDICLAYTFFYNAPSLSNFRILRPEINDFLGAAHWAFATERYAYVERFAFNLFQSSKLLNYEGMYYEAVQLLEKAALAAQKRGNTSSHYAHLGNLGSVFFKLGRYDMAIQYSNEALRLSREHDDEHTEELMLINLGAAYLSLGDVRQAHNCFTEAIPIARKLDDQASEAMLLGNIGILYLDLKLYDEAYTYLKQAVELSQKRKDWQGIGINLANLGRLFWEEEKLDDALGLYKNAIKCFATIGDRPHEASAWHGLGFVQQKQGDNAAAIQSWEKARALFEATNSEAMVGTCTKLIVEAQARLGAGG